MAEHESGRVLGRVTVTKVLTDDDVLIYVDASTAGDDADSGEELPLVEALGMIELAKDTLIRQAMGDV